MDNLPTVRQLTYLRALADHGAFGSAAAALGASQPALSSGIRELEKALGAVLVDRSRRDVAFTDAGIEAVRRARDVLSEIQSLRDAVLASAEPLGGVLKVGVIPTIAPYVISRLLEVLAEQHERLRPQILEDVTANVVDHVKNGVVDVALLAFPVDVPGFAARELFDDPLYCVCRPDDPFAEATFVDARMLKDRSVLVLEDGHCLRDHALAACGRIDVLKGDQHAASSLPTLLQLVRIGHGVTVAPEMAVKSGMIQREGLRAVPMRGASAARRIGLLWRPNSPKQGDMSAIADAVMQIQSSNENVQPVVELPARKNGRGFLSPQN